ncbi:biosynthetic-type acetolactate synthase large subunit [Treponema sp. Marseille-Q4523]|uniref:biosynthetic-type acetolactate synthase large subunit n=1 Tax=Treponema sp. Marseille-Q4523 TaxID=2810610 RepID=UPI0019615423|nr:biosynthetic-type acetolactate synthase large subunit [Treponema sp. Marseille-Q4523]MBM7023278.1 biosynthetic-type acetolactate synthase large subunit [Treponema sp. Marseille-Q4523]
MKYTGAQIVVECLIEQGVDTVFGYPGGAILNIYDELYKNAKRLRHILTAHEQGASHAADGYARSSGKVGVVMATSGPGATNLVTGIATAYMDSVPMVAITCNVIAPLLGKDSFQEIDITGVTMPITKHNFIVRDVGQLADTIREAFFIAKTGRPGPVLIDIPKDVTAASCDYVPAPLDAHFTKGKASLHRIMKVCDIPDEKINKLASLINASERPFIYAGGGVIISNACEELKALAEKAQIPVSMSLMGKSAFPNTHALSTGMIGMHGTKASNTAVDTCDLLLAIGTRFSDRVIGDPKRFAGKAKIVQIDVDPAEVNKNISVDDSLVGSIKDALSRLLPLVEKRKASDWNAKIDEWKAEVPPSWKQSGKLSPKAIFEYVNGRVPSDTIVTTEVGQHQMWTALFYHFEKPRTFLTSGGLGTMGFGTGAAIGAQFANPDKTVVHFAGDGSFRMNCNELATISRYGLPIIIIIFNNGALGNVRQWQTLFYEKRYSATTLDFAPDFVKLADAYGVTGVRVTDEAEFKKAFDTALASGKPAVIDAAIDKDEMVLPMIPPGKSVDRIMMDIDL